jgi:predicted DNA-binding transcriptional regulator YafY
MSRHIIDKAILEKQRLYFTYTKYSGERSTRNVSNISYSNEYGEYGYSNDHIKGYCHTRNEDRTFRISRISNVSLTPLSSYTSSSKKTESTSSKEGCYIATMVYGDYNHPQVLILRDYRDKVLRMKWWGPTFIKLYYTISPRIVNLLSNSNNINRYFRILLNNFITILKK